MTPVCVPYHTSLLFAGADEINERKISHNSAGLYI